MLNDNESQLGRALAGGHIASIAKATAHQGALREQVFLQVLNLEDEECSKVCQKSDPSRFQKVPVSELATFQWEQFIDELRSKAPTLLHILQVMSSPKQNSDSRHYPGICIAVAVLLKGRNREMCGIQSLIHVFLLLFRPVQRSRYAIMYYQLFKSCPCSQTFNIILCKYTIKCVTTSKLYISSILLNGPVKNH